MIYFVEKQTFPSWIKWLMGSTIVFSIVILFANVFNSSVQIENESIIASFISLLVLGIVGWLIFSFTIHSKADGEKFSFSVSPLGIKKEYAWNELKTNSLYRFNKIGKFPGGWGIRWNFKGETYYTTQGYYGIKLVKKSGQSIIIGTNKVKEAQALVDFWKKKYG